MKLVLTGLCALAACALPVLRADTVADTPAAAVSATSGKVGEALRSLPLLTDASPNLSARYYIYLCSASWCGPCNREMPQVVRAYEEMKQSGQVELILLDADAKEADALTYMEKYGATFPATMSSNGSRLPGFVRSRGIPYAIIVDADGNPVKSGHGSIISNWKSVIAEYEREKGISPTTPLSMTLTYSPRRVWAEKGMEGAAAEGEENILWDTIKKIKWYNGRPSRKAKYYIIFKVDRTSYVSSFYGRRTDYRIGADMPAIAKHGKDMKKDGRVELLFISGDQSKDTLKGCLKEFKAKCPAALLTDENVHNLPAMGDLSRGYMGGALVRASDCKVIRTDNYSIKLVADWKEAMLEAEDAAAAE